MRILSMTATFGKLSHETLTLEPGLNVIEAPNEWGKSTWCAFLMAMLYGIDTGSRTKTGFLADKEHYSPWSGEPMSGSMTFLWKGKEITLQRQNKGRTPLGEVRAFETQSGVPVPELAVAAPGQVLLGVERSVFARAGFLRLTDMPVTEDESLRRRLNALVTTGDESDASDDLAQKLRDLKNRCRFNKKGLLPELESKQAELQGKLQQLRSLQEQIQFLLEKQKTLAEQQRKLHNHKQALAYQEQLQYVQKRAAAQVSRDAAEQAYLQAQKDCENLPQPEKIQADLVHLQQLRDTRDGLHTQAQLQQPLPPIPVSPEIFRGKTPEQAVADAQLDRKVLTQLRNDQKTPVGYFVGGVLLAIGLVLLLVPGLWTKVAGGLAALAGTGAVLAGVSKQRKLKTQIAAITERYRGISPDHWETLASEYAAAQKEYTQALHAREQEAAQLHRAMAENSEAISALTGGMGLAQFEELCRQQQNAFGRLEEQRRTFRHAQEVLQALETGGKQAELPQFADTLDFSAQQTEKMLADTALEGQMLHQRLGQFQGQMESLGQEEGLQAQIRQVGARIETLEMYYRALVRAQETLQQASQELQRRFAPRISQRAQEHFAHLTGHRYQRLTLGQDLSLEVSAQGENTMKGTLWRSDGTVDQLYLALRLAVAEELTPDAPLILDDALVRFDDVRLAAALVLLRQEAEQKQVILFTCQSREKNLL